jgi:hypothetical protein
MTTGVTFAASAVVARVAAIKTLIELSANPGVEAAEERTFCPEHDARKRQMRIA